ncbi:MAG: hypothetical protein SCARUB_01347 [Candidatus Scalindua rubra]|uniref:Uncharacterized protein n=1 Tax=Candidatus Scalindua rubra TaxID=1872076 RepID=A0A1E3XD30_9BACT|nr:MAG: hypothetical protein SCARUB_01347 [Candidatus Scalindua rubra]
MGTIGARFDDFKKKRCTRCGRMEVVQTSLRERRWICTVCKATYKERAGLLYRDMSRFLIEKKA